MLNMNKSTTQNVNNNGNRNQFRDINLSLGQIGGS